MTTKWYDRAKALMKERGITNVDIGAALGQSGQSASMKLSGERPTTVDQISVIAGAIKVNVAELLADDDDYVRNLDEHELLKLFRLLSSDQRVSILNMMRSFVTFSANTDAPS